MNAEIAKIIGVNLDSNGTMVLFSDVEIVLESGQTEGQTIIGEYEDVTTATNVLTQLRDYLDENNNSHTIQFKPGIYFEDLAQYAKIPLDYAYGNGTVWGIAYDENIPFLAFGHYYIATDGADIVLKAKIIPQS